jgi:hypothetical protein
MNRRTNEWRLWLKFLQFSPCETMFNLEMQIYPFADPEGSRFQDSWLIKMVMLSGLGAGHLNIPGNIPVIHLCYLLCRSQDHSAAGKIMLITYSNSKCQSKKFGIEPATFRLVAQYLNQLPNRERFCELVGDLTKGYWLTNSRIMLLLFILTFKNRASYI